MARITADDTRAWIDALKWLEGVNEGRGNNPLLFRLTGPHGTEWDADIVDDAGRVQVRAVAATMGDALRECVAMYKNREAQS